MATLLLVLVVVLVIGGLVFGVVSLLSGDDPGLAPAEPDGRARPLPNDRSLHEEDLKEVRFDVGLRGYRMAQVDRMLRRTAYDLGYKDEMIAVLEAEVIALREGRREDAELLRKARESASTPVAPEESSSPTAWAPVPEEPVVDLGEIERGGDSARDAEAAAPGDGNRESVAEDEQDEDQPELAAATADRTADTDADLPREGSLRRREPLPAPAAADALTGSDGTTTIDVADRPAHA